MCSPECNPSFRFGLPPLAYHMAMRVMEKGLGEPPAVAWTLRCQRCVMGAKALPAFNLSSTVKWLALGCKQLGEGLKKMWILGQSKGLDTTYAEW